MGWWESWRSPATTAFSPPTAGCSYTLSRRWRAGPWRGERTEASRQWTLLPQSQAWSPPSVPVEYGDAPAVQAPPAHSSQESRQTRTLFHFPLQLDRDGYAIHFHMFFHPISPFCLILLFLLLSCTREAGDGVFGSAELGSTVDAVIHDQHDRHGDVKRNSCRVNGVAKVLADQTHTVIVYVLCPAKEWRQSDWRRKQPYREHHFGHTPAILLHWVS